MAQCLALAIGVVLLVLAVALAPPLVTLLGGDGEVRDEAVTYLRIAALGAPAFMLAGAGQGFLVTSRTAVNAHNAAQTPAMPHA